MSNDNSNTHSSAEVYALQAAGLGEMSKRHARPTGPAGKGKPYDNMPPYVALRYCIKQNAGSEK